jgi:hypothetical protein
MRLGLPSSHRLALKIGTVGVITYVAPICASCGSGIQTMKDTLRSFTGRHPAQDAISVFMSLDAIRPHIEYMRAISNPAKLERERGMATFIPARVGWDICV